MSNKFILSCESTVDMPYSYVRGRDISVLFYSYSIDGVAFEDEMGKDPEALEEFYKKIDNGALPSTSQINEYSYLDYFNELLQKGDVLHIAFGSGMTPSVNNARSAAEQMREKYPERKLIVIDSTCSCGGYGLLVDTAADLRDEGKEIEEIEKWVVENCHNVHHQFYVTDLKLFKRSGRVSGLTATAATILGICPIMHLNYDGKIVAYSKVRGKKNAISTTVQEMKTHANGGAKYDGKCIICHANSLEDAITTKELIEQEMPLLKEKVRIYNIGTIIASHCGPGTVAVFFMGDERVKDN